MVDLAPMDQADFESYVKRIAREYAADKVKAGQWPESGAEQRAKEELRRLLPDGLQTEKHYFYQVRDESLPADVGMAWLNLQDTMGRSSVWVYDLYVQEQFRRQGYGLLMLQAVEKKARELGAEGVGLHVFGHNHPAVSLYQKAGYETRSVVMAKKL